MNNIFGNIARSDKFFVFVLGPFLLGMLGFAIYFNQKGTPGEARCYGKISAEQSNNNLMWDGRFSKYHITDTTVTLYDEHGERTVLTNAQCTMTFDE